MTWETVPLGEVVTIDARVVQPFEVSAEDIYVGLENIRPNGVIDLSMQASRAGLKSAKNRFDERHVLFGKLRPNLGKVARPDVTGVCSTDIYPLLPGERLDRGYLAHYLLTPGAIAYAASRATGANLPRISSVALTSQPIPLPHLAEQRRIAAILDDVDVLVRASSSMLTAFAELKESVMAEAVASVSARFPLGRVVQSSTNGLYKPTDAYGGGVPIIRIDSFDGIRSGLSRELKRLEVTADELERFGVRPGDILINRVNALSHLGKSTIVIDVEEPTVFESNIMRITVSESDIQPQFLAAWLMTADARKQLRRRAKKAINQASINQRDVASLSVPSLAIDKQREIVEGLAAVAIHTTAARRRGDALDSLFASLQHRAFRGEL